MQTDTVVRTTPPVARRLSGLALALLGFLHAAAAPAAITELISVPKIPDAPIPLGNASQGSVSADGRFVAFVSDSSVVVKGDTNERNDVFVYDRSNKTFERVSVDSNGHEANSDSTEPIISQNGRYVAFTSLASNLVSGDTNNAYDVFVHDRSTGATTRVSVDSAGLQGNATSQSPTITPDGRYVAFGSAATNLVPNDTNGLSDIFVRDRVAGTTRRVSVDSRGNQSQVCSGDVDEDRLCSGSSFQPAISADGRFVAFGSGSPSLVAGDTNEAADIFVHDAQTGATVRVSVSTGGAQANSACNTFTCEDSREASITNDGSAVAFTSFASNLVANDTNNVPDVFARDLVNNRTARESVDSAGRQLNDTPDFQGGSRSGMISGGGRYVLFQTRSPGAVSDDTNGIDDIFVRDRSTARVERVSLGQNGEQVGGSDGFISADGRYVVFQVTKTHFGGTSTSLYIRDRVNHSTSIVPIPTITSRTPDGDSEVGPHAISADNRYVAFVSTAPNLVADDGNVLTDIFVRDRQTLTTERVSVSSNGTPANEQSEEAPAITPDGRYVVFSSFATNLVPGTSVSDSRVYVRDRVLHTTECASVTSGGTPVNGQAGSVSADGRYVVFASTDPLLVPGATPGSLSDSTIFIHDRQTGQTTRLAQGFSPATSASTRFVAFSLEDNRLMLLDRQLATTTQVSGNGFQPVLSSNGLFVAFTSGGFGPQVFVFDVNTRRTTKVSVDSSGNDPDPASDFFGSFNPSISADGRYVGFSSGGALVPDDTNLAIDTYIHDRLTGATVRETVKFDGTPSKGSFNDNNGLGKSTAISADGRFIAFGTTAADLVTDDLNTTSDVFMRPVAPEPTILRVNSGGPNYTDTMGRAWSADRGFNTGGATSFTPHIANTSDSALYQDERWDPAAAPELQYTFPCPNGKYLVRLHFAENFATNFASGKRVFNVDINAARVFTNVDVFAAVGAQTALIKSATVNVTGGRLDILFRHNIQNPIIDAIEIVQQQ